MTTLVYIIPGLGCEDASNPPAWVNALRMAILSSGPGFVVRNASYTDAGLAERIAAEYAHMKADRFVAIGHSFGGACVAWMQSHIARMNLDLTIDLGVFLDPVHDVIRHGFLANLYPGVVKQAIRIYQTADPLIHSNPVSYENAEFQVTDITMRELGEPDAKHCDVAESPNTHRYIVERLELLAAVSGAVAPVPHAHGAPAI